jgi:hypothetical protein
LESAAGATYAERMPRLILTGFLLRFDKTRQGLKEQVDILGVDTVSWLTGARPGAFRE